MLFENLFAGLVENGLANSFAMPNKIICCIFRVPGLISNPILSLSHVVTKEKISPGHAFDFWEKILKFFCLLSFIGIGKRIQKHRSSLAVHSIFSSFKMLMPHRKCFLRLPHSRTFLQSFFEDLHSSPDMLISIVSTENCTCGNATSRIASFAASVLQIRGRMGW